MVAHNISANVSETAFQLDISPTKKVECISNQPHFFMDTVRQCAKVYQLESKDWQQICQAFHPGYVGDVSLAKKSHSKGLVSGWQFALTTAHQCIKILNTKSIVWRQFYGG
ncbi:hypothetical protein BCD67_25050 [Oscillatoriales cyanobacterium USR001]|nr:hypothetical protein BCD67_25050 [Oscillatoriales cyanobacterium USR001]